MAKEKKSKKSEKSLRWYQICENCRGVVAPTWCPECAHYMKVQKGHTRCTKPEVNHLNCVDRLRIPFVKCCCVVRELLGNPKLLAEWLQKEKLDRGYNTIFSAHLYDEYNLITEWLSDVVKRPVWSEDGCFMENVYEEIFKWYIPTWVRTFMDLLRHKYGYVTAKDALEELKLFLETNQNIEDEASADIDENVDDTKERWM
jgi:hypothetical protein